MDLSSGLKTVVLHKARIVGLELVYLRTGSCALQIRITLKSLVVPEIAGQKYTRESDVVSVALMALHSRLLLGSLVGFLGYYILH